MPSGKLKRLSLVLSRPNSYSPRVLPGAAQAQGAELLVALTHMREPNDRKLAAEVPEFHLILGGHDHHYVSGFIEPHNNLLVKSGARSAERTGH
jgi:hypothetical protein